MEVLGNGSPIKDGESQAAGGNYSCRLSRDMNIGSTTSGNRSKGEVDVRLLLACKAQLSSEVVRLKSDSLRLQKERDTARVRMRELDLLVVKCLDRARDLENRLCAAEDENKKLRGKVLDSSNASALQKLSLNLDKFHSYPWPENNQTNPSTTSSCCFNNATTETTKKLPPPQEDWKEVSQKLLEQMKQEMKELQQLSNNFSLQESNAPPYANEQSTQEACETEKCSSEEIEESLCSLKSETVCLKNCLLQQRKTLKSLISDIMKENPHLHVKGQSKDEPKNTKASQSNIDQMDTSVKPKSSSSQYARLSDDSFRAFFTKHLDSCQSDKMRKTMQHFIQSDLQSTQDSSKSASSSSKVTSPKSAKPKMEAEKQNHNKKCTEEGRVCPICQESFHESVPQDQFEKHVLDHLEEESASLLDQYVVIT